jgi:hypothetical protein
MTPTYILAVLAALGLFGSIALIPMRMAWAGAGTARPAGGGWWILSLVSVALWGFTTAFGLGAHAKSNTAAALRELKVVSAADILKEPDAWLNVPVVVNDAAYCAEQMAEPDAQGQLASRVKSYGEDEAEGEEEDYLVTVDYGVEEDVVKFTLGSPDSKLRSDEEGFTVLPAGPVVTKRIPTNETTPLKGGAPLEDFEERRSIPCGATVHVSGIVTKQGEFVVLDTLPKSLSILTDRPWTEIVKIAETKAGNERRGFLACLVLAVLVGLGQLAGAVMARGKA